MKLNRNSKNGSKELASSSPNRSLWTLSLATWYEIMLNVLSPHSPNFVHCEQSIQGLVCYSSTFMVAIAALDCESLTPTYIISVSPQSWTDSTGNPGVLSSKLDKSGLSSRSDYRTLEDMSAIRSRTLAYYQPWKLTHPPPKPLDVPFRRSTPRRWDKSWTRQYRLLIPSVVMIWSNQWQEDCPKSVVQANSIYDEDSGWWCRQVIAKKVEFSGPRIHETVEEMLPKILRKILLPTNGATKESSISLCRDLEKKTNKLRLSL